MLPDWITLSQLRFSLFKSAAAAHMLFKFGDMRKFSNLVRCYTDYWCAREVVASYPISATIEPVNMCNLRCPYCVTGNGTSDMAGKILSLDTFREIVDELCSYLYLISLFLSGEPFLNPALPQMIRYAGERRIACLVHSNLNCVLDGPRAEELVKSGLSYLSVSADGASQQTYERYRRGGNLSVVLRNIDLINEAKTKLHSRSPVLIWQYLLFRYNEHELSAALHMAKTRQMKFRIIAAQCPPQERTSRRAQGHPFQQNRRCSLPWTTFHVASSSLLLPCCQAYSQRFALGTLDIKNLRAMWNSSNCQEIRRYLSGLPAEVSDDFRELCCKCKKNVMDDVLP